MPSRSLEHATGEEVVHLCTKNLQKGVGKYHFQRFIGRGIIFFSKIPKIMSDFVVPSTEYMKELTKVKEKMIKM